jgi:hypothetical protein
VSSAARSWESVAAAMRGGMHTAAATSAAASHRQFITTSYPVRRRPAR